VLRLDETGVKVPVGHEVTPLTRVGEVTDTPAAAAAGS
jgi:hypothetical protein